MPRYRAWTEKDLQFIRNNVNTMTDAHLGAVLGRSRNALRQIRTKHRITRDLVKRPPFAFQAPKTDQAEAQAEPDDTRKPHLVRVPIIQPDQAPTFEQKLFLTAYASHQRPEFFVLNFSDRLDLFDALKESAHKHYRQPADEMLFILDQATRQASQ